MRWQLFLTVAALIAFACDGGDDSSSPTTTATAPSASPTPATPGPEAEALAYLSGGVIWLIGADGQNERQLAASDVVAFSWVSPALLDIVTAGEPQGHALLDLDGSIQELPFPAGGSWSRDGTRYAVGEDEQLVVYESDGTEIASLDVTPAPPPQEGEKPPPTCFATPGDKLVFNTPVFSPDGERIYVAVNCQSMAGASGNLYAPVYEVALDGTKRTLELETNLEDVSAPRLSPDGTRIAQTIRFGNSACDNPMSLFVADAESGQAQDLTPDLDALVEAGPSSLGVLGGIVGYDWSPTGDELVASFNVKLCTETEVEQGFEALQLLRLDGSTESLVEGATHSPAWSPSGRYVAYVAQESFGEAIGSPVLRVFDRETGDVIDLGEGEHPAWRPRP